MKQGRTLTELAQELERQVKTKRDFVAATQAVDMVAPSAAVFEALIEQKGYVPGAYKLDLQGNVFGLRQHTHRQLGQWAGIHAKYYDKCMASAPELLAENVNHWLHQSGDRRLVRTLDGKARAWLSDTYRVVDNYDVAEAVLPILQQEGAEIQSCEVTDRKLYIKAVKPDIVADIPPKGVDSFEWGKDHHRIIRVKPGIEISNSEIGLGAVKVAPAHWEEHCSNLAVWNRDAMKRYHIGKKLTDGTADLEEYMAADTKEATNRAIMLQARDLTRAALDGTIFEKLVTELREARGEAIEGDPAKAIEAVAEVYQMNQEERTGVLRHLVSGGDLSKYGLHAAVTRMSQDVPNYDRASELEQVGAKIVALPQNEWRGIAEAA